MHFSALLNFKGIIPTQRLNLGLLQCVQILYHPSHQGSPVKENVTVSATLEEGMATQYSCLENPMD